MLCCFSFNTVISSAWSSLLHLPRVECTSAASTPHSSEPYLRSLGAAFLSSTPADLVSAVHAHASGGAHAVLCTKGSADVLRVGGTLSVCGIPVGWGRFETPVSAVAIKGSTIRGNLVGSGEEIRRAVELVVQGKIRPKVQVKGFKELPVAYEELRRGDVVGSVASKVARDEKEVGDNE